jgi:peroxin-4
MVAHSLAALKRLRKELQVLKKSSSAEEDIVLRVDPNNLLCWTGYIHGPEDTPYEDGVFELAIRCGIDYPLSPPEIKFVTRVFHPNVHFRTGAICLDILKKEWSPAWGILSACRAVLALLSDPDAESPLNCDAGNMIRGNDMLAYNSMARMYTIENAQFISWPPPPPEEEVVEGQIE